MFFSPEDDDDFSSSSGSKSNLSSLFGADQAAFNSKSNESLTYTAPKQPKKQAASGGQEAPPALIHATAVQVFKFVNGQYASQGKLGAAVLGSHAKKEYRLLLYASKKQQVTSAKITSSFSLVVQANNYSSFYDDARQSWSLRFDTEQAVVDFAKQVGLARYNSTPGNLIKQDLQPGDGQAVESGDIIEVKYTGSLWTNNTFGKVFDSNATADKLFKFRPGKGKVIKGWEDGVLGMKKGGKRLLAIPPELAYGDKGVPSRVPPKSTLLFEVEISRVKFSKDRSDTASSDTSTPPPAQDQSHKDDVNSSTSSGHSREDEDLRERTASLNKEMLSPPEKGSEKAKLLARMSKMGKNVLKLPGAVAAEPEGDPEHHEEHNEGQKAENVENHPNTQTERVPERPRTHSHEYHNPSGNPHPHSPEKPPIAPRSSHVNRMAHAAHAPSHMTQAHAPQQYHAEYQNPQPSHAQVPPQQQTLALYQTPLQPNPPVYQQPTQYPFPQPPPPFQPVYQQPAQPVFQPAPPMQPPPSSSGGTSDVMVPMLMTESRQHQTEVRQAITKVSEKIDSLEHKIDVLKQSNDENNGAIRPAVPGVSDENVMEASVLMNSIVKLVQENERMKRENVEKTAKIESLNEKISNLLHRSQKYVEQSNIFLEQRNESLQQSSSYSQSKLVELEREKTTLSTELGTYKQNFVTMETELEVLRKQDAENRELLKKTSSQLHKNKTELGTTKETLSEREEEVERLSSSLKNLKQERKKMEGNLTTLEENVSDLKQEKESLEKNLADRKKKHVEVKKRMDEEIEELKSGHEEELNSLKERHRRELTSSSSSLSQQISQLETEMETKWQEKSKHLVSQCEKKWQRKYDDLVEENETSRRKLDESEEKYSTMKTSQTQHLQQIEDLQEKLKDLDETQNKYANMKSIHIEQQQQVKELRERLQEMDNTQKKYQDLRMRSIEMKEKYEQKIQELAKEKEIAVQEREQKQKKQEAGIQQQAAEPSRDKIVKEVKQIMNKVFFKIREEFVAGDSYKGSAIISSVLNIIKTMTLKITSGDDEESEEEDESGDEESGSDEQEEGEISEENEGKSEEDGDESGKEEDENRQVEEKESGQEEKAENENHKVEEIQGSEEKESEEDESGSDEEESGGNVSGKEDESGQDESKKSQVENENEDEVIENEINSEKVEQNIEVTETEAMNEEEGKDGKTPREENVEEGTLMGSNDQEGVPVSTEGPPVVTEDTSTQRTTKSSDSENEEPMMTEVPPLEESEDTDGHLEKPEKVAGSPVGLVRDGSSEEDLDNISNRPVLGSEHTSLSFDGEDDDKTGDLNDEVSDSQGPLRSDLPNVEEISRTSKDIEGVGEPDESTSVDEVAKNKNENDKADDDGQVKSETEIVTDEKAEEEKKPQSLSDFLSDDEDDVQGLFDTPAPKTISTPAKKEESPALKAIPPPLFDDDDDDDDLDWFS